MEFFNRYFWPFLGFLVLFFVCTALTLSYPLLLLLFLPLLLAALASHLLVRSRRQEEKLTELEGKLELLLKQTSPASSDRP